jgi:DNA end-binding protein Ku
VEQEARSPNVVVRRASVGPATPAPATSTRKPRKAASGQKEMLMPIDGRKAAKETTGKKWESKPQRKSA